MIISKFAVSTIKTILKMHSILHIFEAVAAISEQAYITFTIVVISGLAQVLAAYLLPNEHLHLGNPLKFWNTPHTHKKKHHH